VKKIDSDYIFQSLLYLIKIIANGEIKNAMEFGIKENQLTELLTLNSQELHDIANITNVNLISNIEFNPDVLDIALVINRDKSKRRKKTLQLLKAGASYPLLHHLYGLSIEDTANYRKLLNVGNSKKGRPRGISDNDKDELYKLFDSIDSLNDPSLPDLILAASEETEIQADSIWILLKEWEQDALLGIKSSV